MAFYGNFASKNVTQCICQVPFRFSVQTIFYCKSSQAENPEIVFVIFVCTLFFSLTTDRPAGCLNVHSFGCYVVHTVDKGTGLWFTVEISL